MKRIEPAKLFGVPDKHVHTVHADGGHEDQADVAHLDG